MSYYLNKVFYTIPEAKPGAISRIEFSTILNKNLAPANFDFDLIESAGP
jgi:hypothetical protein